MPLVEEVRAFLEKTGQKGKLADQLIALCHVLDQRLEGKLDKLPVRYADGTDPQISARFRSKRRVE